MTAASGGLSPVKVAAPLGQPPLLSMRCCWTGFAATKAGFLCQEIFRERTQRSDVVDDPYPAAVSREDEVVRPRLDRQVAHRHGRETAAFVLRPGYATIDRNIETELSPEKKQIRLDRVFLNNVSIAADCRAVPASLDVALLSVCGVSKFQVSPKSVV